MSEQRGIEARAKQEKTAETALSASLSADAVRGRRRYPGCWRRDLLRTVTGGRVDGVHHRDAPEHGFELPREKFELHCQPVGPSVGGRVAEGIGRVQSGGAPLKTAPLNSILTRAIRRILTQAPEGGPIPSHRRLRPLRAHVGAPAARTHVGALSCAWRPSSWLWSDGAPGSFREVFRRRRSEARTRCRFPKFFRSVSFPRFGAPSASPASLRAWRGLGLAYPHAAFGVRLAALLARISEPIRARARRMHRTGRRRMRLRDDRAEPDQR